jgi:hypothetical protein
LSRRGNEVDVVDALQWKAAMTSLKLRRAAKGGVVSVVKVNEEEDVASCFGCEREGLGKIDESGKVEFEERIRR